MTNPFLAEIRMFAGNFAPTGWALCDGQLLPISQNTALFSLLGTNFGGNGKSTFALPNLQGLTPLHPGQGVGLSERVIGEIGGASVVTLLQTEMPSHNHTFSATVTQANNAVSANNQLALASAGGGGKQGGGVSADFYTAPVQNKLSQMNPAATSVTGGNQPHNNLMPFLGLTFIIALQGVFPSRG
jgi:microcystin-dependent protein